MIGVFDSGIGGLTVARNIVRLCPEADIHCLGDTKYVPYGSLPFETIYTRSVTCVEYLASQSCSAIVVACNTATSALGDLSVFSVPTVGVIEPTAVAAVAATKNGRIGLIATEATVRSEAYARAILAKNPDIELTSVATPLLVPFIERGVTRGKKITSLLQNYLTAIKAAKVDTIILGCTHYPMVASIIARILGDEVKIVSSSESAARAVVPLVAAVGGDSGKFVIECTGNVTRFDTIAKQFISNREFTAQKLDI